MSADSDKALQQAGDHIDSSLESVLCTEELKKRPSRSADYEAESRALEALAQTLADSPDQVLERLAEIAMEVCCAGSAGVSLLDDSERAFYWPAIAGAWAPHVGDGMPREASPCGVVLERNAVQLFASPERHYRYFNAITAPIVEALLAPFHCEGRTVGTVWAVSHDENRRFDAEDQRLLQTLSKFASAAYREQIRARSDAPEIDWLRGGGEMGKLVRSKDWSETPLGPIESWPQSLRTTVSLALASNFPISIAWGPQRVQIYNDGYWPICGAKHPRSMGQDFKECWFSAWPAIGEAFESAVGGETAFLENQRMFLDRHGYLEETFFTFSFSPIRDESGEVTGLFHPVTEMTQQSLSERRLKVLKDLADRTSEAKTVESASRLIIETLSASELDLPFTLLYMLDEDGVKATLAGSAGMEEEGPACPKSVRLTISEGACWPLAEAARRRQIVQVDDLAERFELGRCGPYPEPPQTAFVLPINVSGLDHPFALLLVGVSSRRALDAPYHTFYLLLRDAVTNALTNARSYEEERRRAEELAALDRAKTAFFSNVSHEFRTPLALLLGPLEDCLAKRGTVLAEEAAEDVQVAHRNALRLLKLVNTLLDFSRIEAGRIQASYEPTDLAGFTAELASVFRSALERAGLQLVVRCDPLAEPVYLDRDMWEKIVHNLLSNAFKFTFEGEIEVRLEAVDGWAQLTVRDTGVGIPEEELSRVFERFHRVKDSRGRTHEGTGIGLALVQELVKLHGGSVRVESEVDRGSRFVVSIPFGKSHLPAERIGVGRTLASTALRGEAFVEEALRWLPGEELVSDQPPEQALEPGSSPCIASSPSIASPEDGRPRVLWADDNADMRDYVTRLLDPHFEVEAVQDGQAALEAARARRPDLVLSDIMMPRLDGISLLRELRAEPATADIPVVLLSARAGEESRIEGLHVGADDYLIKPFSARELLARVESQVNLSRHRRVADEALRESEKRFRALTSATTDVVYRMSPDWTEMRHLQGREFIADTLEPNRTWLDKYIHPDDQQHVMEVIRRAIESKGIFELEHRVFRVDGSLGWTYSRAIPILDGRGEIFEWFGAASDVTQRKEAEHALRESRAQTAADLQAMTQLHEIGVRCARSDCDVDDCLQAIVDTAITVTRADKGNIQLFDPDSGALVLAAHRGFDEPFLNFFATVHEDSSACGAAMERGERVLVEDVAENPIFLGTPALDVMLAAEARAVQSTPLMSSAGNLLGMISTHYRQPHRASEGELRRMDLLARQAADFLERKRAESALSEGEERFRMLADNMDQLAWTCDMLGNVTWYNRRWLEYTGLSFEQTTGWGWSKVQHPEHLARVVERLKQSAETGEPWEDTFPLRGADGAYRWFLSRAVPIRDEHGNIVRWFGTNTDVTEQRELQESLREADRRKDEFLATLAHELRNPLAPIRTGLELMRMLKDDPATLEKTLATLERQTQQLITLVDDLLDVSRITRGKLELRKRRVVLSDVVQSAVEASRPWIDEAGHELTVCLPQERISLDADPHRLAQVISNLLNNAAKYTRDGGSIELAVESSAGEVAIAVKDTGIGIPSDKLEQIFEMFSQIERPQDKGSTGLGIGLTLVKQLVTMHGGTIEVQSAGADKGSTFIVRLPVVGESAAHATPATVAQEPAEPRQLRILVVDDNKAAAEMLSLVIKTLGNVVRSAEDGEQAIQVAREFRPDIILMDLGMPKMNGYEAAKRIRQEEWGRNIKLVALTGWGQEEDRQRTADAGFDFHLVKPAELAALQEFFAQCSHDAVLRK